MYRKDDAWRYFATDLTEFNACRHLTQLERLAARGVIQRPHFEDPMLDVLQQRGLEHERRYVDHLAATGVQVVEIDRETPDAADRTLRAMRAGAAVIVQARLASGSWAGWADVLLRVAGTSALGEWLYEPVETKLSVETRGATLIQLCLYGELLTELQGAAPENLRVVKPGSDFELEVHRFAEFRSYVRWVRRNFEAAVAQPPAPSVIDVSPYPEPVAHCSICHWSGQCRQRWVSDDSVALVAGIQRMQRRELAAWGVTTMTALAALPVPLARKPQRCGAESLQRMREQARLQVQSRTAASIPYEILPLEKDKGLAALPVPSPLDVFLDLEGDRLAEQGGVDYLFGYAVHDAAGALHYESLWALSPVEEKAAFERLIDTIAARRREDPEMHVYHYAPYEPSAMKRLMGKYATRADELDQLLRSEVFVDLYGIVRRGVRAGVESYSIKKLEPLYGLARQVDLRIVSRQLRAVECAIAKKEANLLTPPLLDTVESYNRDDCISALELRKWLERVRDEAERRDGWPVPRPEAPEVVIGEKLEGQLARIRAAVDALLCGIGLERTPEEDARWVLAQLLEWHRREEKVAWWEYFRLNEMTAEDLLDERAGLSGLVLDERLETRTRGAVVDRYRFAAQDTECRAGDETYLPGAEKRSTFATVEAIDVGQRTVDLRKGAARASLHPNGVFKHDNRSNPDAIEALLRLGEFVLAHGIDAAGAHRAARDLLLRLPPRLTAGAVLTTAGESVVAAARRAAVQLDGGVLAIQGPPGAGKTFTGARMILDLVAAGKTVGVTAVSHKVIRNLLTKAVEAAAESGTPIRCLHRVSEKSDAPVAGIEEETDSKKATMKTMGGGYDVIGGTAWHWAKPMLAESVDVLIVDEAGQMSLANVLACAQAASNLVLLGDPQQLEQPQKASHPEGSEVSALAHLLGEHETMPAGRGLFLAETWRLHPTICQFTSELFYESKLYSLPGLEDQRLSGISKFAVAGVYFRPVLHEGNQNDSPEEADAIAELLGELVAPGVTWTDRLGVTAPLTMEDVLIVAPYNAQVAAIALKVPGARVGTVDKFQGQEAPVVIYSTTTSSAADAPRGMEFLFNGNRLNVATSRARCVCIIVGNPALFEPECHTPAQMRMANAYCRYLELARVVS